MFCYIINIFTRVTHPSVVAAVVGEITTVLTSLPRPKSCEMVSSDPVKFTGLYPGASTRYHDSVASDLDLSFCSVPKFLMLPPDNMVLYGNVGSVQYLIVLH